jgi:Fic family protein
MHPARTWIQEASMSTSHSSTHMEELCTRITCEYLEMPGLALTLPQATHLWGVDAETCVRALDRLVASGFLRSSGGAYRRDGAGYRAV